MKILAVEGGGVVIFFLKVALWQGGRGVVVGRCDIIVGVVVVVGKWESH